MYRYINVLIIYVCISLFLKRIHYPGSGRKAERKMLSTSRYPCSSLSFFVGGRPFQLSTTAEPLREAYFKQTLPVAKNRRKSSDSGLFLVSPSPNISTVDVQSALLTIFILCTSRRCFNHSKQAASLGLGSIGLIKTSCKARASVATSTGNL